MVKTVERGFWMPSAPEVIELEALLAPIPGENPSGRGLQYEGLYDEIREARRADDDLDQGDWKRELKVADWGRVVEVSVEALRSQTKDLQVAAWLAEALALEHGFVGVRDALRLVKGLHEQFWDTLYPEIDEGDMEARANAMALLDRQVDQALRKIPITRGAGYSWLQWNESRPYDLADPDPLGPDGLSRLADLKLKAQEEKKLSGEDIRKAKASTPRSYYEQAFETLTECWAEFQGLDRVMDQRFGRQTPGLGLLKKGLDEVKSTIEKIVKEKRILEPDPVEPGSEAAGESGGGEEGAEGGFFVAGAVGPIRSRQDAVKRLQEVAEFFRKTEPHSPVAYLVDRAVTWTQMPLEALLEELVKDGGVMERVRDTLGIRPPV